MTIYIDKVMQYINITLWYTIVKMDCMAELDSKLFYFVPPMRHVHTYGRTYKYDIIR